MILSQSAEYALRIAAFLALQAPEKSFRAHDVARSSHIPLHYSSKILRKLVKAKILISVRGKGGGFRISGNLSDVRFLDVLEAVEKKYRADHCVFGLRVCGDTSPCVLHERWLQLKNSFTKWASETTLADVKRDVAKHRRFKR